MVRGSRQSTLAIRNEDDLPFTDTGVSLAELSLPDLEQAVIDALSDGALPQQTIPLDDISGEWLLLTDITGPVRLPSKYADDPDGRASALSLQIVRKVHPDDLSGIEERITIWESQQMYEKFTHPGIRLLMQKGGTLGLLLHKIQTEGGKSFWRVAFCRTAELSHLLPKPR